MKKVDLNDIFVCVGEPCLYKLCILNLIWIVMKVALVVSAMICRLQITKTVLKKHRQVITKNTELSYVIWM